jgi:S-adenosylmethionine:tRNA ribosyltransferase-isomerase
VKGTSDNSPKPGICCRPALRVGEILNNTAASQKRPTTSAIGNGVTGVALKTADFDYPLPPELIAQQPLADRAASRLMVVQRATGTITHEEFRHLGRHLQPGDLLVLNDTKVIPARIWSQRPNVELLLVEPLGGNRWSALVKPGHKARQGVKLEFTPWLSALVEGEADIGGRILRFTGDVEAYLEHHGAPPLPPYIDRPATRADRDRYQTVFAQVPGAIAAPTAGLHFTPEMLAQFPHACITLHVGIGTFRPVKVANVAEHKMHAERFTVSAEAIAAIRQAKRVVAVGTTVVRTLESIAPALQHSSAPLSGTTDIFIRPGHNFRVVDALLTNFHLPKSTLLMLVSAFAGRELVLRAYAEAVRERYRFFSYGDCMLIR